MKKAPVRLSIGILMAAALLLALAACVQATKEPTVLPTPTPLPAIGKTYQWNGTIVVSMLEGRHLEVQRACDSWVLLPQSDDVAKKLEDNVGSKVMIWGKVYTGASIYMRQAIAVDAAFGPKGPVPMTFAAIPEYPCPGESPTPTAIAPSQGEGILYGKVSIGPLCPVEPCPNPKPDVYSSRSLVLQPGSGQPTYVNLNPDGSFMAAVKAGTYSVLLTNCDYMGCNRALPQTVVVKAGEALQLEISIDTGIR